MNTRIVKRWEILLSCAPLFGCTTNVYLTKPANVDTSFVQLKLMQINGQQFSSVDIYSIRAKFGYPKVFDWQNSPSQFWLKSGSYEFQFTCGIVVAENFDMDSITIASGKAYILDCTTGHPPKLTLKETEQSKTK